VARRDLRFQGQAELAHPPAFAPLLDETADRTRPGLPRPSTRPSSFHNRHDT
jgi:hypothetical protein